MPSHIPHSILWGDMGPKTGKDVLSRRLAYQQTIHYLCPQIHHIMVRRETYWSTITDCNGAVEQELSYDAWGNRRDPETWQRFWYNPVYEEPMFDRGFTGHEHLYAFGLINMNGRCYDPMMSSFLSVDAYVQSPDNSQNFNRYSYCLNNPLKYTDPSGWVLVGGMTPSNPFHDNWGQNFGEKIYTSAEVRQMLWSMDISFGIWMVGNEMHGGCSNSGEENQEVCSEEYSTPDDPPGQNPKSNKINKPYQESIEGASAVVAGGAALGQGAAELSEITFLENGLKHLGLTLAGINFFNNFYKAYQGEITIESAIMRSLVNYAELVSARIPYIGPLVSITLSCYDSGGGFDNTIYNNQWWHQLGGNHSTFYSEYYFWKLQQEHKQVR